MQAQGLWRGRSDAVRVRSRLRRIYAHVASGCTLPIKPDEAAHVVGDIGETDFDPRAGKRDRSDKEAYQSVLMRKHMFDRRTDLRFSRIGDPHAFRHQAALGVLAMDARDEPRLASISSFFCDR
jgi:hypothetical protein